LKAGILLTLIDVLPSELVHGSPDEMKYEKGGSFPSKFIE